MLRGVGAPRKTRFQNPFGGQFLFGDGSYSGNITGSGVTVSGNNVTITGASTVAPDATTGAAVVVCNTLTLDGASASLTPSTNCKGLIIFAKTKIEMKNGAKLNIDKLGKAGNFGNLTVLDLMSQSLKATFSPYALTRLSTYVVFGDGAVGGDGVTTSSSGNPGQPARAMQTGGGGSGMSGTSAGHGTGKGGKGGPCSGGAGSGGNLNNNLTTANAGDFGGPGSDGAGAIPNGTYWAGGGAGDPVGAGSYPGKGPGGGLLMLFTPALSIASACVVSADGAQGGLPGGSGSPGGSAGGGCVCVVTKSGGYSNAGTVRAAGGAAVAGGSSLNGGAGGAGSVNILTVN